MIWDRFQEFIAVNVERISAKERDRTRMAKGIQRNYSAELLVRNASFVTP
jgi:hypothetical protein